MTRTSTKDFAEYIRHRLQNDEDLADLVEEEHFSAHLAMQIHEARTSAGISQKQLAERAGTQQSVISRLEDSDYDGHSLSMLKRIARALDCKLRVELFPKERLSAEVAFETEGDWPSVIDPDVHFVSPTLANTTAS